MAESQLPVLTLDFSDEKIKALQEIADKFRAGFAVGPGGFPVSQPKPIPGDNHKPSSPGKKTGGDEFDKFLKELKKDANGVLKDFKLINKTLKVTTSTLKDLFSTTVSWGTKLAALAVGGPFGYDMLMKHASSQLMNAQGLNMTFGQTQAAASVYGSRFSATSNIEQLLATAQANPNSQEFKAVTALGLDPHLGAAGNLPKFFEKTDQLRKQYGGNALAMFQGMGLPIDTQFLNQEAANSKYLPFYGQQYGERSKALDGMVSASVMRGDQDVYSNLTNNGQEIYSSFLTAISNLNPSITKLSDTITNDITGFLNGQNGKKLFTDISEGLTSLGNWLNSDTFQTDLTSFENAIKDITSSIGKAAEWIADPKKALEEMKKQKTDDAEPPTIAPWMLGGLYAGLKLGGGPWAGLGAYAGYLYGDRKNISDSAQSSWDYTKQNIGDGMRWVGINTDYGLPAGTVHGNNIQSDIPGDNIKRGMRNNNPGNLKFAGQAGATLEDGPDASHAKFLTMAAGLAALDKQVELYIGRGRNTINSIFDVYSTKNKGAYKAHMMKEMGIGLNEPIDPGNRAEVIKMLRGIVSMENGSQSSSITDRDLGAAYDSIHQAQRGVNPQQELKIKIIQNPGSDITASLIGTCQIPT